HIHLLPCGSENTCHVNHALEEAACAFKYPDKFDFKVTHKMSTPLDPVPSAPGTTRGDEKSEKEDEPKSWHQWCHGAVEKLSSCPQNVSPANCPHFFVG